MNERFYSFALSVEHALEDRHPAMCTLSGEWHALEAGKVRTALCAIADEECQ